MGSIRIESDGTTEGTRVIDTYTGEEITNIISINVICDINGTCAEIKLVPSEVEIEVQDEEITKNYV